MKSFTEILELAHATKSGSSWRAKCPSHDDRSPSLAISEGREGGIVLHCHAGCETESVLSALGLVWADVLPERQQPTTEPATKWEIRDAAGALVAEHVRYSGDAAGKKRFGWRRAGSSGLAGLPARELPLYRSEFAQSFAVDKSVFVCEGEKATDAAAAFGLQALGTVTGAASTPGPEALSLLRDRDVILWSDFDAEGLRHMSRIAEALEGVARSVRWLHVPGARRKDDAADYRGTIEQLRQCVRKNPPELVEPVTMFADRLDSAEYELGRLHRGDLSDFIPTGIASLDRRLGGGLRRGQVILVGAPTGAGKTTLVVRLAMAAQERGLALVVSPEMSAEELVTREIVRRSGRPKWNRAPWAFESTRTEAEDAHRRAADELRASPPNVALIDSIDTRLDDVMRIARAQHGRTPLSLVALDYAQQLADIDGKTARHLQVGEVAHRAVELARELHCPVVVTSQVNTFKDGREKDYSFRESQILEHKAHVVLLFSVERDNYGRVERASFRARKARDIALFQLDVDFDPATFSIDEPEPETPELRDWTGATR